MPSNTKKREGMVAGHGTTRLEKQNSLKKQKLLNKRGY